MLREESLRRWVLSSDLNYKESTCTHQARELQESMSLGEKKIMFIVKDRRPLWQVHSEKGVRGGGDIGKAGGDWSSQLFSIRVKDSPFIFITIESLWTILDCVKDSDRQIRWCFLYFPKITVVALSGMDCGGRGKDRNKETIGRVLVSDTGWDQSARSKMPRHVFWKKNLQDLLVIVKQKDREGKKNSDWYPDFLPVQFGRW